MAEKGTLRLCMCCLTRCVAMLYPPIERRWSVSHAKRSLIASSLDVSTYGLPSELLPALHEGLKSFTCQVPGCVAMVQQWIEGMGAFVKALDPNHMVTVGAVSMLRHIQPLLLS